MDNARPAVVYKRRILRPVGTERPVLLPDPCLHLDSLLIEFLVRGSRTWWKDLCNVGIRCGRLVTATVWPGHSGGR